MRHDKMVSISQENSRIKVEIAKHEIKNMLERNEKIIVTNLAKKTGLSRAFFYVNPEVRKALDDAIRQQGACYNPKQIIIDRVMEDKLNTLKIMNAKLKKENTRLKFETEQLLKENKVLKERLERQITD